jgi:hypothetical protein
MDMNNRKAENRSDQKGYDIAIEVGTLLCLVLSVFSPVVPPGNQQQVHNLAWRLKDRN